MVSPPRFHPRMGQEAYLESVIYDYGLGKYEAA
jgi:hypothetical protein